jgi:16S rRNA (cytosine1402-N4)-methyltransferase
MRMDSEEKKTASYILNNSSVEELSEIFENYGEINGAYKLANAVVEKRKTKLWLSTKEFCELCEEVLPSQRRSGPSVSTLCFQALRIAVNDELNELDKAVTVAIKLLKKGGRIGVISYHSLEDRIVKNIFRKESMDCLCNVKLPICKCGHKASVKLITKKPLVPTAEEVKNNKRASSAKMRVAEKIV